MKRPKRLIPLPMLSALAAFLAFAAALRGPLLPLTDSGTFLSTRLAMAIPTTSYAAKLEKTQYRGWSVYRLTNGIISLLIAPDLGGRAIQLQLGDQEFFFVNADLAGKVLPPEQNNVKAGWANYGGDKVWPAPEGWMSDSEWPSIPYYILDGSKFTAEVITNNAAEVAVRVTSPQDPRTGVQFARTFHVYAGTTRLKVDQVMRNISRRQIRWGIWHLVQHDAADARDPSQPNPELYMYVPLNPHSMFPEGYYKPYGDTRHPSYEVLHGGRMLRIHYLYRVGKIGADSDRGWYAVVNGQKNICFVENFNYVPGAEYPDNASVESWNDGPGTISRGPFDQTLADDPKKTPYFLESEVLSPYATLHPGEEYSFPVYWSPTRIPYPIRDAVWAGAISEPLSAVGEGLHGPPSSKTGGTPGASPTLKAEGSRVTLKGVFGVFVPGTAEAVFYSKMGEELAHEVLQAIDPREVVRLDKSIPVPAEAFRVSVLVRDADGENRGVLGNAMLK